MILRFATPDDVPAVLAFWKLAAEDTNRGGDDTAAVRALIERDPAALRLAVDSGADNSAGDGGGDIVGSLIAGFDGWRCHLYRFAVHPARRRQGIGAMLLADAEERFRGFGGRRADAMVLDDNSLAHHAWAAAGYTPQDDWRRWVKSL
ncbi:GNAT family N-acetyltransferase [Dactylosporangium sp. NPDC050688]|uniref:GNAT family N-acetyltransferase n=1 Tax=Dactylosporangium sp. NPDC050688 TaxID=3157217 RepID=UPI0033C4B8BE